MVPSMKRFIIIVALSLIICIPFLHAHSFFIELFVLSPNAEAGCKGASVFPKVSEIRTVPNSVSTGYAGKTSEMETGTGSQTSSETDSGTTTGDESEPGQDNPEGQPLDLFLETVALDIATCSHDELVEWCIQLGLSGDGSDNELRARLYDYYKVKAPEQGKEEATRIITIENAKKTEYVTLDEPYPHVIIRFTGDVIITIKDTKSGETHTIHADELVYNKTKQLLSARGNIRYEKKTGSTTEIFLGGALDINLDTWEGLFRYGENRREGGETQTKLVFQADDIIKKSDTVIVFKNAVISTCDTEDKHYSLRASKLWILGPNEWAVFNAMLYVGELPVLYLPFFYYPGEEIIFHPVFGYKDREGRFVQTTTYILGERAPKDQSISLFKLTEGGTGYERKAEGVFLRTQKTKKEKKEENVIKILADYYVNLGFFTGIDAVFPVLGPVKNFKAFLGLGFTKSIFPLAAKTYSPYVPQNDYTETWNTAYYFGLELPLRFLFTASGSISALSFSGSYAFDFASDPYVGRDFLQRSEYMDWLQFMKEQEKNVQTAGEKKSSLQSSINLNGSIPLPFLEPFVKSISINNASLALSWILKTKQAPGDPDLYYLFQYSPTSEFFVPDMFKILEGSMTITGTLVQYPFPDVKSKQQKPAPIPGVVPPWSDISQTQPSKNINDGVVEFKLPDLYKPDNSKKDSNLFSGTISYQITPSINWSERFNTGAWKNPEDVDFQRLYELISYGIAGNIQPKLQFLDSLITINTAFTGSSKFQERLAYLDDPLYVTPVMLEAWLRQDAQYRNDTFTGKLGIAINPFNKIELFSPTQFGWDYEVLLYEYKFKNMSGTIPLYETYIFDWTKAGVKTNSLNAVLGVKLDKYTQSVRISGNLPPLLSSYSISLQLAWFFGTFSAQTKYYQKNETDPFMLDPLNANLTLKYEKAPTLTMQGIYDFNAVEVKSINTSFQWDTFSLQILAKKGPTASFVIGQGWVDGAEEFNFYSSAMSYKLNWKPLPVWKNRISFETQLSVDAVQNFIRFNEASAGITGTITLKIYEFADFSFSFTSRNQSLWRYYANLFQLPEELEVLSVPVNPFIDIFNGFRFDNPEIRKTSLFKLKSLNLKLVHYMHDWNLTFELSSSPFYNTTTLQYEFKNTYSIFIGWTGVPEIKTQYKRDGDTETW